MTWDTRHAESHRKEIVAPPPAQNRLHCGRPRWRARGLAILWICPAVSALWGAHRLFGPADFYEPPPSPSPTCGAMAIVNLCRLKGLDVSVADVFQRMRLGPDGIPLDDCARVLAELGMRCSTVRFARIVDLPESAPCLCVMRARDGAHAVVALRSASEVLLIDGGEARTLSSSKFDAVFGRVALVPCVQRL